MRLERRESAPPDMTALIFLQAIQSSHQSAIGVNSSE